MALGKLVMSTPDGEGALYNMTQKITIDADRKMSVAEMETNGDIKQVVYSDAEKVSKIAWPTILLPDTANFITCS